MGEAGAARRSSRIGRAGGSGSRGYRLCRLCRFGGVCGAIRKGQLMRTWLDLAAVGFRDEREDSRSSTTGFRVADDSLFVVVFVFHIWDLLFLLPLP